MAVKIFRINYKSDFILTLNSDAGWMTPFCIKFWTGAPSQAYFVGWDGETYTHCAYDPTEPTKLLVQFDDHHLPIGDLKFQIAYHFTVADFPDDTEDEVINPASIIVEIDGEQYQVMLDFTGETAPEIAFSLPAYANEAHRIANEQQRIIAEEQRIANEQARIAAETTRQQNEEQRIQQESMRVHVFAQLKQESEQATDDANAAATLANQKAQLAADKAALADDAATLANQKAQLAADKAALANDAAQLANEKAALAQQKAEYAQQQGSYAKDQGDYAKNQGDYAKEQGDTALADHQRAEADHGIAVDDHTQAGNDHTRAESDHGIAVDDHTQAGNDHTRAESDHGIAVDDHTQAGNDHTRAESDHSIAADDHTQAGNDHTRAESDHTRAESDHAAVEVYVDSLGAFDISAYHATSGVLAKYADLTAALGTNGVNIPEAIRKGGMSVKFVLSSDNKYVQYFLTKDEWSANAADWEKINLEKELNQLESEVDDINEYLDGEQVFVDAVVGSGGVITFNPITLSENGDAIEFCTIREATSDNNVGNAFLTNNGAGSVTVRDGVIGVRNSQGTWMTNFNAGSGQVSVGITYTGARSYRLAVEEGNLVLYQTYNGETTLKASTPISTNVIQFDALCGSYNGTEWIGTLKKFIYTHNGVSKDVTKLDGFATSGDVTITYTQNGGIVGDISDLDERVGNLEESQTESEYTVAEEKIIPYTDNSGYVSSDTGEIVTASNAHTAIIDVSSGDIVYIRTYQTAFGSNYGYGFVLSDNSWVGVHTTQSKEVIIQVPDNSVTFKMAWSTNYIRAVDEYFYLGKKVKIEDEFKKKKTDFQFFPDFDLSRIPNVSFIQQTNDINDIYGRYDALVSTYPSYVTKVDCSDADSILGITRPSYLNNIPIYMYCFKPTPNNAVSNTNYIKRPSVLILTGVHAGEKLGIYTTYSLMKMVCENWKNDINAEVLRTMADIYVIPLVNPWGFINCVNPPVDNPYAGRTNGNGVNLNRNFPTLDWHSTHTVASGDYEGSSAGSEYETKIVCYYASQIKPDVFFDWHTGNMNVHGEMGTINCAKDDKNENVVLAVSKSMSARLIKDNGYDGNTGDFPNDPDTVLISYSTFGYPNTTGLTYIWSYENVTPLSFLTEQCMETKWKDGVLTDSIQSQNTDVIYRENLQFSYNILLRALYAASQLI